jgi:hypothetical protein
LEELEAAQQLAEEVLLTSGLSATSDWTIRDAGEGVCWCRECGLRSAELVLEASPDREAFFRSVRTAAESLDGSTEVPEEIAEGVWLVRTSLPDVAEIQFFWEDGETFVSTASGCFIKDGA